MLVILYLQGNVFMLLVSAIHSTRAITIQGTTSQCHSPLRYYTHDVLEECYNQNESIAKPGGI